MEPPTLNTLQLELHVPDFEKTKDFYSHLGFAVVWERKPEGFKGYLVLSDGHTTLCFWGGNEHIYDHEYFGQFEKTAQKGFGVEIVLMVEDLDLMYTKMQKLNCVVEGLQVKPWGLRDFRILDPFGFYIRITTFHNVHDSRYAVK